MWVAPHQQALDVQRVYPRRAPFTRPWWPQFWCRLPIDERLDAFQRAVRSVDPEARAERKARIREALSIPKRDR